MSLTFNLLPSTANDIFPVLILNGASAVYLPASLLPLNPSVVLSQLTPKDVSVGLVITPSLLPLIFKYKPLLVSLYKTVVELAV